MLCSSKRWLVRPISADEKRLIAVRKALKRIETDDFGFCLECGEDINLKRLDVAPETELCLDCQSLQERRQLL